MKVAELRAELGARGLSTAGLKAVLEARLEQAQQGADDANEGAAGGEEDDDEEPMDWDAASPREVVQALSELVGCFDFDEAAGVLLVDGDDWGGVDAREAVQALEEHFGFGGGEKILRKWQVRQRAEAEHDDDDVEEAEAWGSEEEDEEDEEQGDEDEGLAAIIPMPGQDLVSVGAMVVGTGEEGFQDGAAAAALFGHVAAMLHLPDGRVLVADRNNHRIRVLSADLQQVSTVAGNGERGHRDGAAAQARFSRPTGLALLQIGRASCRERV